MLLVWPATPSEARAVAVQPTSQALTDAPRPFAAPPVAQPPSSTLCYIILLVQKPGPLESEKAEELTEPVSYLPFL